MDGGVLLVIVGVLVVVGLVVGALAARREPGPPPQHVAAALHDLRPQVVQLLHRGKAIEAIKQVRVATRLGLADAKEVVDRIAAEEGIDPRSRRRR